MHVNNHNDIVDVLLGIGVGMSRRSSHVSYRVSIWQHRCCHIVCCLLEQILILILVLVVILDSVTICILAFDGLLLLWYNEWCARLMSGYRLIKIPLPVSYINWFIRIRAILIFSKEIKRVNVKFLSAIYKFVQSKTDAFDRLLVL